MRDRLSILGFLATVCLALQTAAWAGQAPGAASDPDIPVSHHDRVYSAEQFSNTVSVTDPVDNKLVGVIRLGDPQPGNFSPLYRGQVLVHGMGFAPDHKTIAVVSIGSNSVTFIDTATNAVKHTAYVGRLPHEAFFTPDGKEVWVTVRGEGNGTQNLQQLDVAGRAAYLELGAVEGRKTVGTVGSAGRQEDRAPTSVSLFDQGLIQVLQASGTGLGPKQPYILALAHERGGEGQLEPLAAFMTNPDDQSGGLGDRQRHRRDPPGRPRRG
jgi:YVTN family beta-propeller protein